MPPRLLPFAPPSLHDAAQVRHAAAHAVQSDLAFANIYLLRGKYGTEVAFEDGFLFRHFGGQARLKGYAFPCGAGDPRPALRRMQEDAMARNRPFRFCLLTEAQVEYLSQQYPGAFTCKADPGDADYIYERALLAELPGARFHRKRNHLERFRREYPGWNLAPLTPANADDALAVAAGWLSAAEAAMPSPALRHEYEAIERALESLVALELFGAVLYVDSKPVAMAVGSMLSADVADIHYEKCLPDFRAAYPAINQGLASMLSCRCINREEDLNHEGLRKAKLSYFPAHILTKYTALPC